eukprot:1050025-Prorocentrum_minimum.AAC.6
MCIRIGGHSTSPGSTDNPVIVETTKADAEIFRVLHVPFVLFVCEPERRRCSLKCFVWDLATVEEHEDPPPYPGATPFLRWQVKYVFQAGDDMYHPMNRLVRNAFPARLHCC